MGAVMSGDGLYRYHLSRRWGDGGPCARIATFVMLNPSTADASLNDPTITRCINFARSWDCEGLAVVNLYAFRATDPKGLWRTSDPVGPRNDDYLTDTAMRAKLLDGPIIGAWGANAKPDRVAEVLALPHMDRLSCLGTTKAGAPRHPLYLKGDTLPTPWPVKS